METATKVPLDNVLSSIGIGWFHVQLWWISGFGFSAAAVEVVMMSFIFPELRMAPWLLNEYQLGTLATVIGCGSIFGETVFGHLADTQGRRNVFILTASIVFVFGVLSAFASSVYSLAALRFCVGVGYGGNIAIDFTMYSEFLPTQGRGKMLFLLTAFWPFGQIFASLLAWSIIPWLGWRWFVAACAIPSLITAFARPFIPESPRWLLIRGRSQEATEVVLAMALKNGKTAEDVGLGGSSEVCLENEHSLLHQSEEAYPLVKNASKTPFECLTSAGLLQTTAGLLIIVSCLNYTGYGTLTLMPSFLEMKGIPKASMYQSMVFNSVAQIPGVIIATASATYLGRLIPLRVAVFLTGFALAGFAMVSKSSHVMACTMFASCFLEAGWALYHVYVPEVYPTECRALATGFLSAAGSIIAILGPLLSAALLESRDPLKAIYVFSSCAMFGGMSACLLLHIETKDRDLIDISQPGKGKEDR